MSSDITLCFLIKVMKKLFEAFKKNNLQYHNLECSPILTIHVYSLRIAPEHSQVLS